MSGYSSDWTEEGSRHFDLREPVVSVDDSTLVRLNNFIMDNDPIRLFQNNRNRSKMAVPNRKEPHFFFALNASIFGLYPPIYRTQDDGTRTNPSKTIRSACM